MRRCLRDFGASIASQVESFSAYGPSLLEFARLGQYSVEFKSLAMPCKQAFQSGPEFGPTAVLRTQDG